MKDRLEQFIEENRDSFDSYSMPDENSMWEKITYKRGKKPGRRVYMKYFYRAASVLLIFSVSYLINDFIHNYRGERIAEKKMNDIYEQIPELKEAEKYYSSLVSSKLKEIKPFLAGNPALGKDVNIDLQELDSVYASLKNDLKDNVANDQIIEAMIQNYRLKLGILEDLYSELKKENIKENEKPKHTI